MRKYIPFICSSCFALAIVLAIGMTSVKQVEKKSPDTDKPIYDTDANYMYKMIEYAARNDNAALSDSVNTRNAKLTDLNLSSHHLTVDSFLQSFETHAGFALDQNYLEQMIVCCKTGDIQGGLVSETKRNLKITAEASNTKRISFNDLFLLSKIIQAEAGSDWLSDEWKMCVGEVVLNRVSSPEFPNTIQEVLAQPGQYYGEDSKYFNNLLPSERSVRCAVKLLNGDRLMVPSVVFQANFAQGSKIYLKLSDSVLGNTYFCHSRYMNLY